jgi:hypothetical protein
MENTQTAASKPELHNPGPPEMRDRPDFYLPSDESLDFLLDHQIDSFQRLNLFLDRRAANDLHEDLESTWEWFSEFLPALKWFIDLSDQVFESRTLQDKCLEPNPDFAPQIAVFSGLLTDVMAAYMPAKMATLPYGYPSTDAAFDAVIELLRRYWLFVRSTLAFTKELFPGFYIARSLPPLVRECECKRMRRLAA